MSKPTGSRTKLEPCSFFLPNYFWKYQEKAGKLRKKLTISGKIARETETYPHPAAGKHIFLVNPIH